ncbi:MAG: hypothetical protein Q8L76_15980 [Cypionkella sp.]|nr:hypothetical protein [Cypionkella sp.]
MHGDANALRGGQSFGQCRAGMGGDDGEGDGDVRGFGQGEQAVEFRAGRYGVIVAQP